ncbi:MAG: hypothetical protein KDA71_02745 [Planctomycetales bacterium]|nr:hypothetical protein [Planctomycetales bacterium]
MRTIGLAGFLVLTFMTSCPEVSRAQSKIFPSWGQVLGLAEIHFQSLPDFERTDLLSQAEVSPLFESMSKQIHWEPADRAELLRRVPATSEFLVQQLRSERGTLFMRKVAGEELIYDRLDRISRESGGQALIRDLIKLPDAERYAKKETARAVPDLVELLPRKRNSRDRVVKDYDQPTGRLYTIDAFMAALKASYDQAAAVRQAK